MAIWLTTDENRKIQNHAESDWQALPLYFRIEKPLKLYDRQPTERDFMVSARLNHLHILLLLRRALGQRIADPDPQMVSIAAEMLSLATEAALLKQELANSGTSLVWKVSRCDFIEQRKSSLSQVTYYALPAAGIICLALLQPQSTIHNTTIDTMKIFQDLSVLVAQVETGALVDVDDPNYALLSGATQILKTLLKRVLSGMSTTKPLSTREPNPALELNEVQNDQDWIPWNSDEAWDFEMDFWNNLAEHPVLAGGTENTSYFP